MGQALLIIDIVLTILILVLIGTAVYLFNPFHVSAVKKRIVLGAPSR